MGDEVQHNGYISQLLTKCELFTVDRYKVTDKAVLKTAADSFNHILVIDGKGELEGKKIKKGDSYFVPASYGEYTISGNVEALITKI
jgi:mannose-6-phosphate isomerase class I